MKEMQKDLYSVSITDEQTRKTIKEAYETFGVILEPHGAVGWAGLMSYIKANPELDPDTLCVSLETAHPAKFPAEIMKILSINPELPDSLKGLEDLPETVFDIPNNYTDFREYLLYTFNAGI
jgi:threonine synthase